MLTVKEAANILGLSSDDRTRKIIQEVRLDAYKAGLMQANLIASATIYKNQEDYCPKNYPLPREQYLSGLTFKVTSAIETCADNATVDQLKQ